MSFHKTCFDQKYCNQEVTSRLKDDLKSFIFYWTYGKGGQSMGLSKAQISALERSRNIILKYALLSGKSQ